MNIYNLMPGGIGIKKLTDPDLGSITSHQTHIGLYHGTLSHLPHLRNVYNSQLIYEDQSYEGLLFLKFINDNRSPAINLGTVSERANLSENIVSIGEKIRDICNTNRTLEWYLIWFALDNNEIITILFNQYSSEYRELNSNGNMLSQINNRGYVIQEEDRIYIPISEFLNNLITTVNLDYIKELEIATLTGSTVFSKRVTPIMHDIEKANEFFKETGKKGEELLADFLNKEKNNGRIKDYTWVNKSRETGYPYDFEIRDLDNILFFSDAKSTNYSFTQKMVLSNAELRFINDNKEKYLIHRLYDISENPKLRVCNNISAISDLYMPSYNAFNTEIIGNSLSIRNINLVVPTDLGILVFNDEITLNNI